MRTPQQARDLVRAMNLPEPTDEAGWTRAILDCEFLLDLAKTLPPELVGACDLPFMYLLAGRCPWCRYRMSAVRNSMAGLVWTCAEGSSCNEDDP